MMGCKFKLVWPLITKELNSHTNIGYHLTCTVEKNTFNLAALWNTAVSFHPKTSIYCLLTGPLPPRGS